MESRFVLNLGNGDRVVNTSGIWTERQRCGGKPCMRNTRMKISQILAELADGGRLSEIAEDFELDYNNLKIAWHDLVGELCKLRINSEYIMSDSETRGGQNCVQGHRIPISMILMGLLDSNHTPKQEAHDYDLEQDQVEGILWNLASLLDRNWMHGPPENIAEAIRKGPE